MIFDPVVEEVHQIRERLSHKYNNNLHAICEAIRHSQSVSGRVVVSRLPRPAQQSVEPAHGLTIHIPARTFEPTT